MSQDQTGGSRVKNSMDVFISRYSSGSLMYFFLLFLILVAQNPLCAKDCKRSGTIKSSFCSSEFGMFSAGILMSLNYSTFDPITNTVFKVFNWDSMWQTNTKLWRWRKNIHIKKCITGTCPSKDRHIMVQSLSVRMLAFSFLGNNFWSAEDNLKQSPTTFTYWS